jgi:uncharacterized membrane-anchored protein YjiN (DUF445 family)
MQPAPDEALKEQRLRSMKRRATALLVVASVVFVAARLLEARYGFWMAALRATAEASMIGGLADWFAVTALFRHPLGIPIPHTAIVPRRKDRVGRTLGQFVQRNFLNRDVIGQRLRSLGVAARVAEWIAAPANARAIAVHAAAAVSSATDLLPDDDAERVIGNAVATRVRTVKVAPILGRLLTVLTEGNRHQELLNEVLRVVTRAVHDNGEVIRQRIGKESPWWLPDAVDEKIYVKIVGAIERTMAEIEQDPAHPLRERFDAALRRFTERLDTDPAVAGRIEGWKEELLATETARKFTTSLWTDGKAAIQRYALTAHEREDNAVARTISSFGERVLADPELLARLEEMIIEAATYLVQRYESEVGELIETTVASWDPEVTSRRVELAIGRDLQFIRINGTLVGGLAGLVLFLLTHRLP